MFKVLANAFKVEVIRKKIFYILFILLVFRIGSMLPLPGIDLSLLAMIRHGGDYTVNTNIFSVIAGGGYGSIMSMGIGPYITASIIMQLLTYAIPKLDQINKEGPEGRKKINHYTRWLAVALATLQGGATVYSYVNNSVTGGISLFKYNSPIVYVAATVAMVTGTIFIMWLAELLTERGIGNGSSFIIFANILSSLPAGVQTLWLLLTGENMFAGAAMVLAILAVFVVVMAFVVLVQDGERRIPVQYSKKLAGRGMMGQNSYIPIKVNIAGVMSIIFALSITQFPLQLASFFPNNQMLATISKYLDINHWFGTIIYVVLIFCFTFFYTSFAINTVEMAENMKKNGGFIPGVRPGRPTSDFVQTVVDRMSWIGAFCYSLIAITPVLFQRFTGINIGFGGTTLLIVTGVALEFIKQLESQLLMRHYKGFLS